MMADEFITWAMRQPEGPRYELVDGEVVAMSPERVGHARTKLAVVDALRSAVARAGAPCETFVDGLAVRIDDTTVYEPDALVRCGDPLDDDAVETTDPLIVVEVLSPSSRGRDAGAKLADYFRLASVRHYLIVSTSRRSVIHHHRTGSGDIRTRILHDGELRLDPPGLTLPVAEILP
jgi:Uma2 family endonuclease